MTCEASKELPRRFLVHNMPPKHLRGFNKSFAVPASIPLARRDKPRAWHRQSTTVALGEHRLNHMAVDVGQATVCAVVFDTQLLVIDAHQMQYRRMEVVIRGDVANRTP